MAARISIGNLGISCARAAKTIFDNIFAIGIDGTPHGPTCTGKIIVWGQRAQARKGDVATSRAEYACAFLG
jgi:hypothetical protein